MLNKHDEIEVKLPADDVNEDDFVKWAYGKKPHRFLEVEGPDLYYKQGENVVRHRIPPIGTSQLTVKSRKSNQSTKDRLEVDLGFDADTTAYDVEVFLKNAGFEVEFELYKRALIFWYKKGNQELDVSYYIVTKIVNGKPTVSRKYIEIEASKHSKVTPDTAKRYLKEWTDDLNTFLKKELKPINKSLYEIFKEENL